MNAFNLPYLRSNSQNIDTASQVTIHVLEAHRLVAAIIFGIDIAYSEMY